MALQAGFPLLDYSPIRGRKKQEYFAAVQAGLERKYRPMEGIFREVIRKTFSTS
jgi:cell filamentation protein